MHRMMMQTYNTLQSMAYNSRHHLQLRFGQMLVQTKPLAHFRTSE
jgi:hypothetical protein